MKKLLQAFALPLALILFLPKMLYDDVLEEDRGWDKE
jgi:hypothetical protein